GTVSHRMSFRPFQHNARMIALHTDYPAVTPGLPIRVQTDAITLRRVGRRVASRACRVLCRRLLDQGDDDHGP
ncbi:MAG: hypothetical protein ACRYFY_15590, partial [Janthinobacterium lividum]